MNEERLQIYLDDHFALMVGEAELAARCHSSNSASAPGQFLQKLGHELSAQKLVVKDVVERIGGKSTIAGSLKQGAAWFAEKLGRFKLNDSLMSYSELSRVIELETLAAAAQERVSLWDNLSAVQGNDPRLNGITFALFREQSQEHLDELNKVRRIAASEAFRKPE